MDSGPESYRMLAVTVAQGSMKGISILGSTGSIGTSTISVTQSLAHAFRVVALSGGRNVAKLASQVEAVLPAVVSSGNEAVSREL